MKRQFCTFSCYRAYQGETSIERTVRLALDSLGVEYEQEFPVGRRSIDFYLPDLNSALEVDGQYWHQDESKERRRDITLENQGINVIHLGEADIKGAMDLPRLVAQTIGLGTII